MEFGSFPVIGITPTPTEYKASHGTFQRYALNRAYADAVTAAGGLPLILPYAINAVDQLVSVLDGLILSGGADVDPRRYGDTEVHPATYDIDAERDEFEITLVRAALQADRPIFGICRGIQVLNVALGGSLYQDVPDQIGDTVEHRQQNRSIVASDPCHTVVVSAGSTLHDAVGTTELPVNSFHHQAIRELAPDLEAVAAAEDGVIEAVQHRTADGVFAVEWHPELMFHVYDQQLHLFKHLVGLAGRRRALVS